MNNKTDLMSFLAQSQLSNPIKVESAFLEEPNLGVRKAMEDFTIREPDLLGNSKYSFYAILDGHGGSDVARFSKETLPKILRGRLQSHGHKNKLKDLLLSSVEELSVKIRMIGGRDSGTTLTGILLDMTNKQVIYFNVGDSRVLAVRYDSKNILRSDFKTPSHTVTNE